MSAGESYQETVIGHPEFVAGLATSLEQAPLELSDKSSKTGRGGVYELEFVLDVTLRYIQNRGEYVNI